MGRSGILFIPAAERPDERTHFGLRGGSGLTDVHTARRRMPAETQAGPCRGSWWFTGSRDHEFTVHGSRFTVHEELRVWIEHSSEVVAGGGW